MDRLDIAIEIVKEINDKYCKKSTSCTDCKKHDECNTYFKEYRPYEFLGALLILDELISK